MNNKMSATGVLAYLIYILEMNLSELISSETKNDYIMGSWEACIECLEIIAVSYTHLTLPTTERV